MSVSPAYPRTPGSTGTWTFPSVSEFGPPLELSTTGCGYLSGAKAPHPSVYSLFVVLEASPGCLGTELRITDYPLNSFLSDMLSLVTSLNTAGLDTKWLSDRGFINMVLVATLFSLFTVSLCRSIPRSSPSSSPYTQATDLKIHDPTVINANGAYYAYGVGEHIVIHQAPGLAGPWKQIGSVLDKDSIIPKGDRAKPWAPTTIEVKGTFYCYYSVSNAGCRDSAIGVATSQSPGPGGWTDHGAIVQSGTGQGSDEHPFNEVNAIDPAVLVTGDKGHLVFGSYWSGIWQVPLNEDFSSVGNTTGLNAHHLAKHPKTERVNSQDQNPDPLCRDSSGRRPVEGAYISYHAPYYYLWLSWGQCCDYDPNNLPPSGEE
ncbi:unnamed protein product [Aspergillus oryzae]|uniref:Unnamed protein product n=1 Tax=Aspergillus oryzae TaxID=5062 RepID=A0AAN4YC71_ASPOZ|nr:unnamed protein product [Aspergillus oryzae]GMF83340.1 unnamed protein product [Aspergillus oryzae]GMG02206.1 unnamed protein product [Aspergillus oryzae]GMG25301.1 unnamed protein product [Aspergillus oryzae]